MMSRAPSAAPAAIPPIAPELKAGPTGSSNGGAGRVGVGDGVETTKVTEYNLILLTTLRPTSTS